jgi:hypothetical protein
MAQFHSPRIVTDGLVLMLDAANGESYPGTGTVWTDLSGNGNNGTLVNGPTFSSGNGGSLVFDGIDDRVNSSTGVTWFSNASFTVETWFKFDTSPPSEQLWFSAKETAGDIPNTDIHLRVVSGQSLRFGFLNNDLTTSSVVTHSQWYNVVCNYDAGSDTSRIYVNSTQVASGNQGPYTPSTANIGIGYWVIRNAQHFKGSIASTKIYTRALTAAEILQNYNATKGRYGL